MSVIKRVFQQCLFQVDEVLASVEDHQSTIKSALKEQERVINEARYQAHCMQGEINQVQAQLADKKQQAQNWQQRAAQEIEEDESLARQCLMRQHQLDDECIALERTLNGLNQDFKQIEETISHYISEFKKQQDKFLLMKAQSATADVQQSFQNDCFNHINTLDDSFKQWEEKIFKRTAPAPLRVDATVKVDSLEEGFEEKERNARLEQALTKLKSKA